MASFIGNASWYNLCNGSNGACSSYGYPCNNNHNHVAWPKIGTGCNRVCGPNPSLGCGSWITINHGHYCSGGSSISAQVRDCCSCDEAGCELNCRCNGQVVQNEDYDKPVVDCTTSLFIALGGDLLLDGRIPVKITT